MVIVRILTGACLLVLPTVPVSAQERADRYAHAAILDGDLAAAEARLRADQRIFPKRPEILLNLAAIYARTNRAAMARSAYAQVLEQADLPLQLSNQRSAASHAIARQGLAMLDQERTEFAVR